MLEQMLMLESAEHVHCEKELHMQFIHRHSLADAIKIGNDLVLGLEKRGRRGSCCAEDSGLSGWGEGEGGLL